MKFLLDTNIVDNAHVSSDTTDPTPGNNDGSASTLVVSDLADLTVTKSVVNPNPPPGGLLTYTITVTNHGPSATTDTVVFAMFGADFALLVEQIPQLKAEIDAALDARL